jgi:ElaB/YqjD/DUF883 family membrane-anchored ribosome-binding protein
MTQAENPRHDAPGRSASESVREAFSSLGSTAEEKAKEILKASREKFDQARKKSLDDLYSDAKTYIRENPGKSLLGALVTGFILGKILRRR